MPELPEVETTRRDLAPLIVGRVITDVWVADDGVQPQAPLSAASFRDTIVGRRIERLERRGKYLIAALSGGLFLVLHRRMTGNLVLRRPGEAGGRFLRAIIYLQEMPAVEDGAGRQHVAAPAGVVASERWVAGSHDARQDRADPRPIDGATAVELHWEDQRRFGTWRVVVDPAEGLPRLGPEPLAPDWTANDLAEALKRRTAPVKAALLDQQTVAGLGNIYVDESLHAAGIHPLRSANTLSEAEIKHLHQHIRAVLEKAITLQGSSARNYVGGLGQKGGMQEQWRVYDRSGQPCYGCGTPLVKTRIAGRGTHLCPACQPEGTMLPRAERETSHSGARAPD